MNYRNDFYTVKSSSTNFSEMQSIDANKNKNEATHVLINSLHYYDVKDGGTTHFIKLYNPIVIITRITYYVVLNIINLNVEIKVSRSHIS